MVKKIKTQHAEKDTSKTSHLKQYFFFLSWLIDFFVCSERISYENSIQTWPVIFFLPIISFKQWCIYEM